ncbi:MAG: response regulator [Alphaproteobacteria bacterium]|nr:MAG: response regulator [Alphaproteobacteria bacterium]
MSLDLVTRRLSEEKSSIVKTVFNKACHLLDHTPRFRLFTLHGHSHLSELFRILEIILKGGVVLTERQLYLLSLAICTHDLGMAVGLTKMDLEEISEGRGGVPDPSNFENFIRDVHHEIISYYFRNDLNFLTSLGVTIADLGIIAEIGECHRKVQLQQKSGDVRALGALLRVIDELDVGPNRAPASLLESNHHDMDPVSKWHWFKHSITEEWAEGHNVEFRNGSHSTQIIFSVAVRPTRAESIGYWITQVVRPIRKALSADESQAIIMEVFRVKISVERSDSLSRANGLGGQWAKMEEDVLTHGRKVILVVDDDAQRLQDVFFPLLEDYHVKCIPSVKTAFQFLDSVHVDLAVVDLQMPTEDFWTEDQVDNSRMTGFRFAEDLRKNYPAVKICILTGSKHPISAEAQAGVDLFLRKPIDPFSLKERLVALIEKD